MYYGHDRDCCCPSCDPDPDYDSPEPATVSLAKYTPEPEGDHPF